MIKKILIGLVGFIVVMLIIGLIAGEDTTESTDTTATETSGVAPEQVSVKPEQTPDVTPEEVTPVEDTTNETPSTKVEKEVTVTEAIEPKEPKSDDGKLTDAKKAEIIEYFKGDDEPNVLDALFPYSTLKLGMHNDGSNRDGYAEYACQVLQSDFGIKETVTVTIIDIDKLVSTDKWETIGKANCNY